MERHLRFHADNGQRAADRPPAPCWWLPHELSDAELGRRAQPV